MKIFRLFKIINHLCSVTNLTKLLRYPSQFSVIEPFQYLKGLNLTPELHPSILELAKVAFISLPLSWGRYLLSAMES